MRCYNGTQLLNQTILPNLNVTTQFLAQKSIPCRTSLMIDIGETEEAFGIAW